MMISTSALVYDFFLVFECIKYATNTAILILLVVAFLSGFLLADLGGTLRGDSHFLCFWIDGGVRQ